MRTPNEPDSAVADGSGASLADKTYHETAPPAVVPQSARETSKSCGCGQPSDSTSFVYVIGKIRPRFPSIAIEKEFAQAAGRLDTAGLTDQQSLKAVLSQGSNRYLVRQLCWVLTVEGIETYILLPRYPSDFDSVIATLRPTSVMTDIDVVIGHRGRNATPHMCNGLVLPVVAFDQIYSFDREALIKSLPKPEKIGAEEFTAAAGEVLDRILQIADNAGATDEHRALNYLAVRYNAIYAKAAEQFANSASLTSVEVRRSPLSGLRKIVDVVFTFTHRATDVSDKFSARVDVTDEFPFLVAKLAPFYER